MDFGMIANVVPPARYPNVQRPHLLEPSRRSQLIPPFPKTRGRSSPTVQLKTVRRPPIYPKTPGHLPCSSLTHPLPLSSPRPSVSFGGFGLRMKGER